MKAAPIVLIGCLALTINGCGSSPTSPSSSNPPVVPVTALPTTPPVVPTPAPSLPASATISGTVTATNGARPLAGVTVTISTPAYSQSATTGTTGQYSIAWPTDGGSTGTVTIAGGQIVTRQLRARLEPRTLNLDAIERTQEFSPLFYEQFVRNRTEDPNSNYGLLIQTSAPQIYLRTVDDAGRAIDARSLDMTAAAIVSSTQMFTGRFGVAGIERGTETREGMTGWITVRWRTQAVTGYCGMAQYGGTLIELFPANRTCGCGGSVMSPRTVKHEMGHALGFFHTDDINDVMNNRPFQGCDADPSPRERYHGAIAYKRQRGNATPDSDLATGATTFRTTPAALETLRPTKPPLQH